MNRACRSANEELGVALVRKRRIQAIYDVAGLITESEARSILEHAVSIVDIVKGPIDHERTSG